MTVMIDRFFGVHPYVIRSGLWSKMKPGEKDLYIFLMTESERCCTRELRRTDAEITKSVGVSERTLCNARKKLRERGLILCRRREGNKYQYTICNPASKEPYPGDPRAQVKYMKNVAPNDGNRLVDILPQIPQAPRFKAELESEPEQHGVPISFDA